MNSNNTKFHFPANKVHIQRYAILLIFLGLAAHFLLPQIASFEKTMVVVKQMKKWFILLALLAQIVSYIGNGFLLHTIAKIYQQKLSVGLGTVIITAAGSVGLVAGGLVGSTLAILRWTRKQKIDMRTATLSSLLPSLLNTALITILSIFGLIHLLIVHELTNPQIITFSIILFLLSALSGVIVWGSNHQQQFIQSVQAISQWLAERFHRKINWDKTAQTIESSFKTWEEIRHNQWQLPLLGAAIYVVFDMLTLYLVFIAANHPVTPGVLLTGYGLPLLMGKAAFILPGGVGVIEGTMTALYTGLGVFNETTVAVVLIYRFLSFWMPTIIGFLFIIFLQRGTTKKTS